MLDIGFGNGALFYVLYKNGLKVIVIGMAEKIVEKSKEKLKIQTLKFIKWIPIRVFHF